MGRMSRREMLKGIVAVGMGLIGANALSACKARSAQTPAAGEEKKPAPTEAPAKLVFSSYFGASGVEAETLQALIDSAVSSNPGLEVELLLPEANYTEKILAMYAAGQAPDIILLNSTALGTYTEKKVVLSLEEYMDQEADALADYYPIGLQSYTIGGTRWALPTTLQPLIEFCNVQLFEEAGVDLPPKDWEDTSWTIDKFVETAIKLSRDDDTGKRAQFGYFLSRSLARWCHFLWSYGGGVFDDMNDPVEFTFTSDSQAVLDTLKLLQTLAVEYHVGPQDAEIEGQSITDWFQTGKVAIFHEGIWHVGTFSRAEAPEFKWTNGVPPRGPGGRWCRIGGDGAAVSSQSKYPDQAWKVISSLYGEEALKGAAFRAENTITIPTTRSAAESPGYMSFFDAETKAVWLNALEHGKILSMHPRLPEVWRAMQPEIDAIFLGNKSPEEALSAIEENVKETLAEE